MQRGEGGYYIAGCRSSTKCLFPNRTYGRFNPDDGALGTEDLLWILEQIPGTVQVGDVTPVLLEQGYWGRYVVHYQKVLSHTLLLPQAF